MLCSLDAERGRALVRPVRHPEYTARRRRELLARDDIDVIDICTPPSRHFELAARGARAPASTSICEKPLVGSLADCDR